MLYGVKKLEGFSQACTSFLSVHPIEGVNDTIWVF